MKTHYMLTKKWCNKKHKILKNKGIVLEEVENKSLRSWTTDISFFDKIRFIC